MCSSVDYWRCRWIKLGGALEYPQRGPSDPHLEPDLSTVCPQGYPQGWRADPQGWRGGTRRCGGGGARPPPRGGAPPARAPGGGGGGGPGGGGGGPPPPRPGARPPPAPGRLGGPHPGPRAGERGRLLLFGCGSPRCSRDTARPGPCRRRDHRGAQPGTAPARPEPRCPVEAVGVYPRRAGAAGTTPPPPPHPGARPDRGARMVDIVGVLLRTRIGSELEGLPAQRGRGGCAGSTRAARRRPPGSARARGGPVDAAARGTVATPVPFAPSVSARARAVRWRSDPATQKGGRRGSFTLRPALLPSRSGAMTPFPGRAGAAAHPKDTHRPPFSAPPTPRAATAGPPEASTAPGPSSTPARTATAGAASRSPRGNHRTAPGPARISRIRADAESAAPAGGVAGASWPASASRRSAAPAGGVATRSRSPLHPDPLRSVRENVT